MALVLCSPVTGCWLIVSELPTWLPCGLQMTDSDRRSKMTESRIAWALDTGRKCDGYLPVPQSQRRTKNPDVTAIEHGALIRNSSSPKLETFDDDLENRSFAFFKDRTSAEISGSFPSDFWERLIPLATFYEPALKHATIALASLHERFEKGDRSVLKSNKDIAEGGFALQQYNKAIRCLIDPDVPAIFNSLEEARNNLDYQWNLCIRRAHGFEYLRHMPGGTEYEEHRKAYDLDRVRFQAILGKWMIAFQAFLDSNVAAMNSKSLQSAMILKMDGGTLIMHLEVLDFQIIRNQVIQDQMCWDKVIAMFENLVDVSATIINAQNTGNGKDPQKPTFQLDHSIIGPLFSVGHKCRDPILRRKAISMLYSTPRQEGVWDSVLTARVCERIMKLEEEGLGEVTCAADIPNWRRVSDIDVTFDLQARRGEVKLSRLGSPHAVVLESVTETLECGLAVLNGDTRPPFDLVCIACSSTPHAPAGLGAAGPAVVGVLTTGLICTAYTSFAR
ncbi:MAG: hypothetical protein Q9169_002114 [Polycauliona sp. 2 TL-2023]